MNARCRVPGCMFTVTGRLRVVHAFKPGVTWTFGLCALHRDDVARQAIETPCVGSLSWMPRADWARDGAAA